jgi:PAS domain S-box-containing protein
MDGTTGRAAGDSGHDRDRDGLAVDRQRDASALSADWLGEADPGGRLSWLSERFAALSGGRPESLLDRSFADLADPEGGPGCEAPALAAALAAEQPFHDITVSMAIDTGRTIMVRLSGLPLTGAGGRLRGWRGIGRNVSAELQRERAWRQMVREAELLTATIEACPVSISIADAVRPGQPLLYVNPSFSRITGYALYEVIDRNPRFLQGPDTDPNALRKIAEGLAARVPVTVELLNYRKDGTPFWNELTVAPLIRNGQVIAYIGVQRDVTEKRFLQRQTQERQKLEALGHLAGGVAHELNNLLQPVMTYADLLRERFAEDAAIERPLTRILGCTEKARDIVRNILRFSRNDQPELEPLAVATTLRAAVTFVRELIPPSVTVTEQGLDTVPGTALMTEVGLAQVMTNLVNNAVQAMAGRGGIAINAALCHLAAHDAMLLDLVPGDYARISVADTGPGMDENTLARLFEPFFTTKPVGEGTGLGLSVVYGILQSWHGAVTVNSAPGKGAEFVLHLPLIPPPAGRKPAPAPAVEP